MASFRTIDEDRPLPLPDDLSQPFWTAAREHRLEVQRCGRCRSWNHPPTILCRSCGSNELCFEPVSGRAKLYTWTVIHDPPAPGFAAMLPLIVGLVELEEQEQLLLAVNLVNTQPASLRIGLALEVTFEDISYEVTLPRFTPVQR